MITHFKPALILVLSLLGACAHGPAHSQVRDSKYPVHWWAEVPKAGAPSWEILPQEAGPGEVILSKRNELGVLSNFTLAPFEYRGHRYNSIEGLWQMMLYPEGRNDPRLEAEGIKWEFTREQVSKMVAFEAKNAGSLAEKNMEKMKIDWVSFEGERFVYRTLEKGRQYQIIRAAMIEKFKQNPKVREVLLATGDLILKPDHHQETNPPPSWRYFEIWMEIRKLAQEGAKL